MFHRKAQGMSEKKGKVSHIIKLEEFCLGGGNMER